MNTPANLSPDLADWIRVQMTLAAANAAAAVRQDMDRLEDWTNGIFAVLLNVVPPLLRSNPDMARQLEPQWRRASERFEQLVTSEEPPEGDETAEVLEARKMLYRMLKLMQAWPGQRPGRR